MAYPGLITFPMGEPKTPHFYDFAVLDVCLNPTNHIIYLWRTQYTLITSSKPPDKFWKYYFCKYQKLKNQTFSIC